MGLKPRILYFYLMNVSFINFSLSNDFMEEIKTKILSEFSHQHLRVILLAFTELSSQPVFNDFTEDNFESDFTLIGLVGIKVPPKIKQN
jgi:magnesium-transporting ATPase (P-type)